MKFKFEWDSEKAEIHLKKHKISFEEATTVFGDPNSLKIPDSDHSFGEERFIDIGCSAKGRILVLRIIDCWIGDVRNAGGGNRTLTSLRKPDFESGASTNSTTPA